MNASMAGLSPSKLILSTVTSFAGLLSLGGLLSSQLSLALLHLPPPCLPCRTLGLVPPLPLGPAEALSPQGPLLPLFSLPQSRGQDARSDVPVGMVPRRTLTRGPGPRLLVPALVVSVPCVLPGDVVGPGFNPRNGSSGPD